MDNYRGSGVGVIVQCEKGYVVIPSYSRATAYHPDGSQMKVFEGGRSGETAHFQNLFDAIRDNDVSKLNGEILEGHLSSALCHTGAISHLLGTPRTSAEIAEQVAGNPLWKDSWTRMEQHLAANGVDVADPKLNVGPWLEMDPATERFTNHEQANSFLSRDYRKGYELPEVESLV